MQCNISGNREPGRRQTLWFKGLDEQQNRFLEPSPIKSDNGYGIRPPHLNKMVYKIIIIYFSCELLRS